MSTKIALLSIGYTQFAFKSSAKAAMVLEALSAAQPVDYKYIGGSHSTTVYWPADDSRSHRLSLEFIAPAQILSKRPADGEDDAVTLRKVIRLENGRALRLGNGGAS